MLSLVSAYGRLDYQRLIARTDHAVGLIHCLHLCHYGYYVLDLIVPTLEWLREGPAGKVIPFDWLVSVSSIGDALCWALTYLTKMFPVHAHCLVHLPHASSQTPSSPIFRLFPYKSLTN